MRRVGMVTWVPRPSSIITTAPGSSKRVSMMIAILAPSFCAFRDFCVKVQSFLYKRSMGLLAVWSDRS